MNSIVIASILLVSCAERIHAAVVEYGTTERDQWFNDVGGITSVSTVDFTGYPDFTPISDQWAHQGIHFLGFTVAVGESFLGFPNDGWGVRGEPDINVSFDVPMRWIGADFPGDTIIQLFDDNQLIYTSNILGSGGAGFFGGLISDQPFDRARFFREDTNAEFLDDLHFGPPIAVPAPGSIAVIGCVLCMARRRRR